MTTKKKAKELVDAKRTFDCANCKYGKQPNEEHPCNTCNEYYDKHVSR